MEQYHLGDLVTITMVVNHLLSGSNWDDPASKGTPPQCHVSPQKLRWREFKGWKLRSLWIFHHVCFFFPARWWMTVEGCYKWHLRHGIVQLLRVIQKRSVGSCGNRSRLSISVILRVSWEAFVQNVDTRNKHVLHQTNSDVFPLVLD